MRDFFSGAGLVTLLDAPWFPVFVFASFLLHPYYGFIAVFGSAVTLLLTLSNEKATKDILNKANTQNIRASRYANTVFQNVEVLQAMGMVKPLRESWLEQQESLLHLQAVAADRSALFSTLTRFFRMFIQTIILGVGAYLVIEKEISPGAIIAGSILVGRALQPIESAVANWKGFSAARSAFWRLVSVFDLAGKPPERMQLPAPKGVLSFKNVIASSPEKPEAPILKGITFSANPGAVIGVIGPSGCGKSSLARVAVGVWPAARGEVRLDGSELRHWPADQLGPYLGYVPQDVELFSGTISQNIARFGEAQPERVLEAARLAGCHEMIQGISEGYNTQIGEAGHVLSAGQRQRIALARALYGNPALVVLDEPNSNLDAEGEQALFGAVKSVKDRKGTVLIVTHKPNILGACDFILIMGEGGIKAYGPRDEILQKLGVVKQ